MSLYSILMVWRLSSFTISNIFSETAWPIKAKFYVEPPWVGGTKVCSRHPGHMTKMAAMPKYGKKPLKNLRNQQTNFHETWYVVPCTIVYSNDDPGLTLTDFASRPNFVTLAFL